MHIIRPSRLPPSPSPATNTHIRKTPTYVRCALMRVDYLESHTTVYIVSMCIHRMTVGWMRMESPHAFMEARGIATCIHGSAWKCRPVSSKRITSLPCTWKRVEVQGIAQNCIKDLAPDYCRIPPIALTNSTRVVERTYIYSIARVLVRRGGSVPMVNPTHHPLFTVCRDWEGRNRRILSFMGGQRGDAFWIFEDVECWAANGLVLSKVRYLGRLDNARWSGMLEC